MDGFFADAVLDVHRVGAGGPFQVALIRTFTDSVCLRTEIARKTVTVAVAVAVSRPYVHRTTVAFSLCTVNDVSNVLHVFTGFLCH